MSEQGHPGWMPPPTPGWQPPPPPYGAAPNPAGGWYPPGGYGYPYPRPNDTNGFAIASLVCSLVGILLLVIGPLLGILFGIVGLTQIPRLGQRGRGLAIAGLTIGVIVLLLDVIGLIAMGTSTTSGGSGGPNGVSV